MKKEVDYCWYRTGGRIAATMNRDNIRTYEIRASFRDVNLKTFIALITMQIVMKSETIQFLWVNHQIKVTTTPIPKLTMSTTLTVIHLNLNSSLIQVCLKKDQSI